MDRKFPCIIALLFRLPLFRSCEYITGDLIEEYGSGWRSRSWLWMQVISALSPRQWAGRPGKSTAEPRFGLSWLSSPGLFFSSMTSDLVYAVRTLSNDPGFTTVAVLAIALGIGVNTASSLS